jgi:carbamoyl-phosphate synthase large subunit
MPKRTDIKSILILGAGPIVIGQACEFDYSGAQACKALKQEGYRVILVNSNPATIMTDPSMADATYIEPVTWQSVAKIIEKERPCAVLPTMGGQTALNCALALEREGVLKQYGVEMIGAKADAIDKAENRQRFEQAMKSIGLDTPRNAVVQTMEQAYEAQAVLGFPCIIRPSFTMGGTGGGIAHDMAEFTDICEKGFKLSPTHELLIDESLIGWKEFEMEVVRDRDDNCIIVCSIENFDAMGVHTGDSITVAPAQTLTDKEYQIMRNAAIAVLREIGVETGGSNVQFGTDPKTGRMVVIEMNPRVSRSSALASKATGFPIAKVAAKLAVGYTLNELRNEITGNVTPASFEPAIDYVVTKVPRFAFEKFPGADARLTTQMKSVGEVMAIGRTFQESLQKALRGLEVGADGFAPKLDPNRTRSHKLLQQELQVPGAGRIWYIADAFRLGLTVDEVYTLSHVDPWFLVQVEDIVREETRLHKLEMSDLDKQAVYRVKRKGFSDARLARLLGVGEKAFRDYRHGLGVRPVYKRVDTCAAEFASTTAYMYSTYEEECEAAPSSRQKIMILGSGPNRIGQGIESDYCCVHAAFAMREDGYETIMVNSNPETVSTDYDTSDRLYFEPITLEDVLEIVHAENPKGLIIHYGGQTPLTLAKGLQEAGAPIVGTGSDAIDRAEDRKLFQELLAKLGFKQQPNAVAHNELDVIRQAERVGYPLLARASYTIGGRGIRKIQNEAELQDYLTTGGHDFKESALLLDRFLENAVEADVDAVSDGKQVVIGAVMQNVELAGVHTGDSASSLPPFSLPSKTQDALREMTVQIGLELGVVGLYNVQFAVQGQEIYVLEANPRAARSVPFVSKCIGVSLPKIAARCMMGKSLKELGFTQEIVPPYFSVKESAFPFNKFPGVDPVLSPEMKSTGEAMGVGYTFEEAFMKAQLGVSQKLPGKGGRAFVSFRPEEAKEAAEMVRSLVKMGFEIIVPASSALIAEAAGAKAETVAEDAESAARVAGLLRNDGLSLVVSTTEALDRKEFFFPIRRAALQYKVYYATTLEAAKAAVAAMARGEAYDVYRLQDLHACVSADGQKLKAASA